MIVMPQWRALALRGVPFNPTQALGATGAWWTDSGMTLATQPTIANTTFLDTVGWTAVNCTLSVETYLGRQCIKLTGTGGAPIYCWADTAGGMPTGARMRLAAYAAGDGDGDALSPRFTSTIMLAAGNDALTTWVATDAELTINSDGKLYLASNTAAGAGAYARFAAGFTLQNLSVTSHAPFAATGALAGSVLAQATPANMGWRKSDNGLYVHDDDAYTGLSKASTRFLHNGTGLTYAGVINIPAYDATASFLWNDLSNGGSVGSDLWIGPTGAIEFRTANALGAATYSLQATSAAGAVGLNAKKLITVRMNAANGAIVRVNGAQVAIDATPVTFGAGDSTNAFTLGNLSGLPAYGLTGTSYEQFFSAQWMPDATFAALERWFAAKHGIALP